MKKVQRNDRFYWISWYRWNSIDFSSFARNGQQLSEMKKVQKNNWFYWISWYIWNSIDSFSFGQNDPELPEMKKVQKNDRFCCISWYRWNSKVGRILISCGRHKMADAIGIRITLDANMDAKCQIPSGSVSFSCPISVVCSLSGRRRYVVGGIGEPECV
jgi:hypothetical protein